MKAMSIEPLAKGVSTLLTEEIWDRFQLAEVSIQMGYRFDLDGHLLEDFYGKEEWAKLKAAGYSCQPYGRLRELCRKVIAGKRTPLYFKFVLLAPPQLCQKLLEDSGATFSPSDIQSLSIIFIYKDENLQVKTGTSYRIFSMDKSLDQRWDLWICEYLSKNDLNWVELV